MKIITNDYCYINKIDIANLIYFKYDVPEDIHKKAFPSGLPIVTEYNEYDYIEVDMNKNKDFVNTIKDLDWIIDLQDLNNAHSKELLDILKSYIITRSIIIRRFNTMKYDEKKKNFGMKNRCDLIDVKIKTLKDYLSYRLGLIKLYTPEKAKKRIVPKSKANKITDFLLGNKKN